jgi:hypothetical protein
MLTKIFAVCLVWFILLGSISSWAKEGFSKKISSKTLVVQIDTTSWVPETLIVSRDSRHVVYGEVIGNNQLVVVDGKKGKPYRGIAGDSITFSSDGQRVAYAAQLGAKAVVVVDSKEEKQYDGIRQGSPIFSPDSKHVAYMAGVGNKQFVVVDGKKRKQYDSVDGLTFSPDSKQLAYGARLGNQWAVGY